MDRKIEKKTWRWQRLVPIALISALVIYFGFNVYKSSGTSRLNVQTERLLLDTVHEGAFQEFIPVTGAVLPIKTVLIGAIEGGRVDQRYVEDGSILKAGQPILELSNPDLQLNYLNQEANIVAQINQIRTNSLQMEQQTLNLKETALNVDYQLDLLGKRVKRNKTLYGDGVISEVDFQETEDEYEHLLRRKELLVQTIRKDSATAVLQQQQMENSLDLMQRNLQIARKSLDNLIVKAPIDGQLAGLTSELGELIVEGSQIAQLDDLSNFKIRVQVDEFYISRVFVGQTGSFQFAGDWYNLSIQKIYPQVINGAFAADMIFTDKTPDGIKRGQTVSVKLELSAQENAMMLARGGFYQTTGGNWVYVLDPSSGVAHKRDIQIRRQNPNFYEITSGLEEGEIVITSSYENFGSKDELILK
ncbi:MAG: HlyD family efflux transporter periplasmic adaptor subunit [Saprospiraceae bacterium]|nr:HlyD family efflux transporter periplasmic adaptor subunit [Saprospiraceae bacterium]